ncbi:MAG: hypothetical protein KJ704_03330, partial [Proteobacteria bacterium]|nr:hypothetical protein [Pseudomonadota bacterium]
SDAWMPAIPDPTTMTAPTLSLSFSTRSPLFSDSGDGSLKRNYLAALAFVHRSVRISRINFRVKG